MKITNLITADILQGIDDINKKCHAMHLPSPPVQFFQMEVRDADGSVVEVLKSKSNSWVRNAYNFLAQNFLPCSNYGGSATFGVGSQSMKNTSGTTRRYTDSLCSVLTSSVSNIYNSTATAEFGIVIGTSDSAESFESHALTALIAHGTGSGQMNYAAGNAPVPTYDSGSKKWTSTMTRTFTNASGSAITIKEIGLIGKLYPLSGGLSEPFLLSRDVLATPITVANSQTLTITYTSEITYPA